MQNNCQEPKFARGAFMCRRYGVSDATWWRWTQGPNADPGLAPELGTPSGDKLWNVARCDERMRSFRDHEEPRPNRENLKKAREVA